jgi:hypothetical protein
MQGNRSAHDSIAAEATLVQLFDPSLHHATDLKSSRNHCIKVLNAAASSSTNCKARTDNADSHTRRLPHSSRCSSKLRRITNHSTVLSQDNNGRQSTMGTQLLLMAARTVHLSHPSVAAMPFDLSTMQSPKLLTFWALLECVGHQPAAVAPIWPEGCFAMPLDVIVIDI